VRINSVTGARPRVTTKLCRGIPDCLPGDRRAQVLRVIEYGDEAEHHERGDAPFHGERSAGRGGPSVLHRQQRHGRGGSRRVGGRPGTTRRRRLSPAVLSSGRRQTMTTATTTTVTATATATATGRPATIPAWRYAGRARRSHVRRPAAPVNPSTCPATETYRHFSQFRVSSPVVNPKRVSYIRVRESIRRCVGPLSENVKRFELYRLGDTRDMGALKRHQIKRFVLVVVLHKR